MTIGLCIFFCLLQSSVIFFLLVCLERERREFYDRLMAKNLGEFRFVRAPERIGGKLRSLKESWRAQKAAKEIEKSENI